MRKAFLTFMGIWLAVVLTVMPAAAMQEEQEILPMSMQTIGCNLSISGMTASSNCSVTAYGSDKISVTLSLQKYKDDGWVTVKSKTANTEKDTLSLSMTKLITAGTFRTKAVSTVTQGTQKETMTAYSAVKTKN